MSILRNGHVTLSNLRVKGPKFWRVPSKLQTSQNEIIGGKSGFQIVCMVLINVCLLQTKRFEVPAKYMRKIHTYTCHLTDIGGPVDML